MLYWKRILVVLLAMLLFAGTWSAVAEESETAVPEVPTLLGLELSPGEDFGELELELGPEIVDTAAAEADCAVVTVSRQAGEGGDRHLQGDFTLSDQEYRMIADVCDIFHSLGKKVTVVLNVGGVVETASWKNLPDAIVLAWQPGQEGGRALARILSGRVCPSGRLPVTFPVDYFDLPSSANFPYNYSGRSSLTGGKGASQPKSSGAGARYSVPAVMRFPSRRQPPAAIARLPPAAGCMCASAASRSRPWDHRFRYWSSPSRGFVFHPSCSG